MDRCVCTIGSIDGLDRAGLLDVLTISRRVRARMDLLDAKVAAALARSGSAAADDVAVAGRLGRREADRVVGRSRVVERMPAFAGALGQGDVVAGHVDAVARAVDRLGDRATELIARQERLVDQARRLSPAEFARAVSDTVLAIEADDGVGRFERQRRANRLSTWHDPISGMWCGRFAFDPESGAKIATALRNRVETLFHDRAPDTAPIAATERHQHLQALAFIDMLVTSRAGGIGGASRPEVTVVIDHETLVRGRHAQTICDMTNGAELPVDTYRRWLCDADIVPAWLDARGQLLKLGTTVRLASRAQRQALRALHPTCAMCDTPFDLCEPHHIVFFRDRGPTDLDNLIPLCVRHHHLAHEGGWRLVMGADRTVAATRPDGTTTVHVAPRVERATRRELVRAGPAP